MTPCAVRSVAIRSVSASRVYPCHVSPAASAALSFPLARMAILRPSAPVTMPRSTSGVSALGCTCGGIGRAAGAGCDDSFSSCGFAESGIAPVSPSAACAIVNGLCRALPSAAADSPCTSVTGASARLTVGGTGTGGDSSWIIAPRERSRNSPAPTTTC